MSRIAYIAQGKTADSDQVFSPVIVIDGVGEFSAERLDEIVTALHDLQLELRNRVVQKLPPPR